MLNTVKVTRGEAVGRGIESSSYGTVDVVVKDMQSRGVAAEYLGYTFGVFFGVNVVPGIIATAGFHTSWLSVHVGVKGNAYDHTLMEFPYDQWPQHACMGRVDAFDMFIANNDRNPGNFGLVDGKPVFFDHGNALYYVEQRHAEAPLHRRWNGAEQQEEFVNGIKRLKELTDSFIDFQVDYLMSVLPAWTEHENVRQFLKLRRRHMLTEFAHLL